MSKEAWNTEIAGCIKAVNKALRMLPSGGTINRQHASLLKSHFRAIIGTLKNHRAVGDCPKCNGIGCDGCLSAGFVDARTMERMTHASDEPVREAFEDDPEA